MPQVKLISPITRQEIRKIRVAAYCRVSSNSADQQNSYANQIRVYTPSFRGKKSGSWWRYSQMKGSLA